MAKRLFRDAEAADLPPEGSSGAGAAAEAVAEVGHGAKEGLWTKFKKSDFARNFKRNWTYLLFLIPAVVVTFKIGRASCRE